MAGWGARAERKPAGQWGPNGPGRKRAGQRAPCNPGRTAPPGPHRPPRPARPVSYFGNAVDVGVTSVP